MWRIDHNLEEELFEFNLSKKRILNEDKTFYLEDRIGVAAVKTTKL